jgi:hypothetical protein
MQINKELNLISIVVVIVITTTTTIVMSLGPIFF